MVHQVRKTLPAHTISRVRARIYRNSKYKYLQRGSFEGLTLQIRSGKWRNGSVSNYRSRLLDLDVIRHLLKLKSQRNWPLAVLNRSHKSGIVKWT